MTALPSAELDPQYILNILQGYQRAKTLFTAVKFGIFDVLNEGALSADQIADKVRKQPGTIHPPVLTRLLNGCVALGLLKCSNGQYANSEVAHKFLVSTNPNSLVGYVKHNDRVSYKIWQHMDDAIIEGTNRWTQVFPVGQSGADLFDYHYQNESTQDNFLDGMHGVMKVISPKIIAQFDLKDYQHLVDLGGGSGQLAVEACLKYPHLHATVFDLSTVEGFAAQYIFDVELAGRIVFNAGDFFIDRLPKGDLYALARVLHDWTEEKCLLILKKIYETLPENGAVLIIETILDQSKTGPQSTVLQDLNMLLHTEGGERSDSEYEELLTKVGFTQVEARRTGACLDVIRAIKPKTKKEPTQSNMNRFLKSKSHPKPV